MMFNNRSSGGGSTTSADVDYLDYASISATNNKKNSPTQSNYSFLDAFPTSPDCSPIGKRGGRSSSINKSSDEEFPSIITTASVVEGAFGISHHIPYESNELITSIDDRSPTFTSHRYYNNDESLLSISEGGTPPTSTSRNIDNTLYYSCITDNSSEVNSNRWVGKGVGGKELQLSVCSISPETIVATEKSPKKKRQSFIPRSIDYKKQQSSTAHNSKLPMLEENKIVNLDILGKKVKRVSSRVLQDVEELSVDLSILSDIGDIDSVASAMTKESVVNLADRLEKMERQLLELAGVKTTKTDALRALAKSTHKQSKRANSLQKKLVKQDKKISTLNDMCDRLMDSNLRSKVVKSKLKNDIDTLKDKLYESELHKQELLSKLQKAEEENVKKSRLLLQSYSENQANEMKQKYNELKSESQRRADNDNITIQTLKSQMVDMAELHSRKEKRSDQKVQILLQIKTALEEQIRLLEEEDDVSV